MNPGVACRSALPRPGWAPRQPDVRTFLDRALHRSSSRYVFRARGFRASPTSFPTTSSAIRPPMVRGHSCTTFYPKVACPPGEPGYITGSS